MAPTIKNEILKVARKAAKAGQARFGLNDLALHFSSAKGFRGYFDHLRGEARTMGALRAVVAGLVRGEEGFTFIADGYFADEYILTGR